MNAALALSKDLVDRFADPLKVGATALGSKGGSKTAERGPEYFARIAAMRSNRKGDLNLLNTVSLNVDQG